jgi:hypothetical protein
LGILELQSMPEEVERGFQKLRERQWISSHIDTLPFVVASCFNSKIISTKRRHNLLGRQSSPFDTKSSGSGNVFASYRPRLASSGRRSTQLFGVGGQGH